MILSTRTGRAANSRLRYASPDIGDALGWKTLFVVPFGCSGVLGYMALSCQADLTLSSLAFLIFAVVGKSTLRGAD